MSNLYFCVFSYNRGLLLENCVKSIEHCAPDSTIIVFDDDSDDPHTLSVISDIKKKHRVITPSMHSNNMTETKLGGLYNNMQAALDMLPDQQLFCFIQDDMQCTHKIQPEDIEAIQHFFNANPNAAFIHPAFFKERNQKENLINLSWDEEHQVYYRENPKKQTGVHFSAIHISRTDILRKANWQFSNKERLNDKKAKALFGKMGFMKNPFCLWLPMVPLYRGKKKTLAIQIAERFYKSGLFAVNYLSDDEAKQFRNRGTSSLPEAESFLRLKDSKLPEPWQYSSLSCSRLLKILNRLQVSLQKIFK